MNSIFKIDRWSTWVVLLILAMCIWLIPIAHATTRYALVITIALLWLLTVYLLRGWRLGAFIVAGTPLLVIAWVCIPGDSGDIAQVQKTYAQCLKQYEGTAYLWGGENRIGIDCSGLVRRGLIDANVKTGLLTLNPQLIRKALDLWWHDCSARAIRDEYRGMTVKLSMAASINILLRESLEIGDLAVSSNGVHVLAYLGGNTWIEADPECCEVMTVQTPSGISWFNRPVQIVRWHQFAR